jgi:photosystem II stability/assembly factor-like uncharacterized protein
MAGVFKSTDGGSSWSGASRGITCAEVGSLVVDPSDPANLYAATPVGIFKSTDSGATWTRILEGGAGADDSGGWWASGSVVVAPSSPETVYARTTLGLFRSSDGGANWTELPGTGLSANGPLDGINSPVVLVSAADPQVVFITERGEDSSALYRSTDGGQTWSRVHDGAALLEQDPTDPSTVYAFRGQEVLVSRSTDAGATWADVGPPEGWLGSLTGIACAPGTPTALYLAQRDSTSPGASTVFRSADGGATWEDARLGVGLDFYSLLFPADDPDVIYATTRSATIDQWQTAVLRSADGGATWQNISGRLANAAVTLVAAPGSPGSVYAVSESGIFRWSTAGD